MRAGKLETGAGVVKGGRLPGTGRMAGLAVCAKLTLMGVVIAVASHAIGRCTFENAVPI